MPARNTKKSASARTRKTKSKRRTVRTAGRSPWVRGAAVRILAVLAIAFIAYIVYLDITIRNRFDGQRWPVPAHVYTRPLELYDGLRLTRERFVAELDELGYRKAAAAVQPGTYSSSGDAVDVIARPFKFWDGARPATSLRVRFQSGQVVGVSQQGRPLSLARLEPRLYGSVSPAHHEDRALIQLDDVPQVLIDALLAVEDRDFFDHFGIDLRGVARALWSNVTAGRVVQGGSTLTQQLIKNFYLTADRTLRRKLVEMLMAVLLELHYSKQQILEAYLNEVYLGQVGNRAIHGFGLGSLFYFGRPLHELNLPEIGLLVGLVRGPSYYHPRRHPQRATQRRNLVLDQMLNMAVVDRGLALRAKQAPLGISEKAAQPAKAYPAYLDFVRRQLRQDYQEQDLRSEGLRIFTTLDPDIQQSAERAVRQRLSKIERARKMPAGTLEAAAVVLRSDNGEVLAIVGGRESAHSGFNRAVDARRPIGSLIKPAVYLAALEQPSRYTLATIIEDEPLRVRQRGSPEWTPQNYDKQFHGTVPVIDSLVHSYNVATARLGMAVGVDRVVDTLRRLGINAKLDPFPSLLLGAVELTPIEVAQMYLTFASGGFRTPMRSIRSVLSQDEQPLARYPLSVEQVVEPGPMALLDFALGEVARSGTARGLQGMFADGIRVLGKTGTSDEFRDSWFAGYAGGYLAVVWVGRDDNKPVGLSGASGAMTVWAQVMRSLDLHRDDQPLPSDIEVQSIDPNTGLLADQRCEGAIDLPFIIGSAPTERAPCASPRVAGKVGGKLRNWFKRLFREK